MVRAYQWDPREKMVRLMSCLRGPALTAHRSLPHGERDNYDSCIDLLRKRCGHDRPIAKTTLRTDLSAIRQEEGESLDMFAVKAYTLYALTVEAYPEMERGNLLDSLAVPAFLKGIRDRSAAQEALIGGVVAGAVQVVAPAVVQTPKILMRIDEVTGSTVLGDAIATGRTITRVIETIPAIMTVSIGTIGENVHIMDKTKTTITVP